MTYKEIYEIAMPIDKRNQEKMNIWVHMVVRPLSIIMTIPLVKTKIKPTTITKCSLIACIIGCFLYCYDTSMIAKLTGWACFFLWAILDGVDGNLARCINQCSAHGELWDATGGYAAMILMYFSAGIAAFFDSNSIEYINHFWYLIMGGATALFSIFPRLIMHKKQNTYKMDKSDSISNKSQYGLKQIIALNLISASGFLQVILLFATITHTLNIFVTIYCIVNFCIMLISLHSLLKE